MMIPLLFAAVPLLIAVFGVCVFSVPVMLLSVPVLFLMVGLLPFCHRRENLWMFVYAAITFIPINVFILFQIELDRIFHENLFSVLLWGVLLFLLMSSLEEIVLGVITRFVWKRQYKLPEFE